MLATGAVGARVWNDLRMITREAVERNGSAVDATRPYRPPLPPSHLS